MAGVALGPDPIGEGEGQADLAAPVVGDLEGSFEVPDLAGGDGGQGVVAGLVDQFAACGAVNGDLFKVPACDELAQGGVARGCHSCRLLPGRSRVLDGLV